MKEEIKKKLPDWWMDKEKKDLILTDDLDSLLSVKLLQQVNPNWKLKYYYDFGQGLFYMGEKKGKVKDAVGVDLAIDYKQIKCFDNHVTTDNGVDINHNSINLNNICGIDSRNYSQKYCCSTALMIYSLYDIPLPKTDMGKALLLAIDSTYYSYFNPIRKGHPEWLKIHQHWLCDVLGFEELYEYERQHSEEDFEKLSFINNSKIQAIDDWDDGNYTLYYPLYRKAEIEKVLEVDLSLPTNDFRLAKEVSAKSEYLNGRHKSDIMRKYNVMSFAMTAKNHCNFSIYNT